MGEYDRALARYGRAIAEFREIEDLASEAYTLKSMAQICAGRLEYAAAERMLDEAVVKSSRIGAPRLTAQVKYALAELHLRKGRAERAVDVLSSALRLTRDAGDVVGQAFTLACAGYARLMLGDLPGAECALMEALDLARRVDNRLIRGRSLLGLSELHLARDDEHLALVRVEEAIGVFREYGAVGVWQARALELLGRVHERAGRLGIAVHAWQAAELASHADTVLAGHIARSLARVRARLAN
jgi:tetratricopeptide (TPR) repeat protein